MGVKTGGIHSSNCPSSVCSKFPGIKQSSSSNAEEIQASHGSSSSRSGLSIAPWQNAS